MAFDRDYLERRAEESIRRAQSAEHPAAVRAHYTMASGYLSQLYPAEDTSPQPANKLVGQARRARPRSAKR